MFLTKAMLAGRTIAKRPEEIGDDYAITALPESHQGPVSMWVSDCKGGHEIEATFPNLQQATRAASYAISPNGGYSDVVLVDGNGEQVTHADWQDWAL